MISDILNNYSQEFSKSRIMEVGCGKGYLSKFFSRDTQFYVGVDLQFRTDWLLNEFCNVFFVLSDGVSLPFTNKVFDFIVILNSLHHFKEPIKALNECYRVCSDNGVILIIEPQIFGDYTSVMNPFENETENRLLAQQDLQLFSKKFAEEKTKEILCLSHSEFNDFDHFILKILEAEYGRDAPDSQIRKEMKNLFYSLAYINARGRYVLNQNLIIHTFSK